MKILQLRFKNLNSLVGEWSIDLTQPAYVAEGIFAIVGPTGAGKSTILDAICLALYGQTPRLAKITKSTNEIMSRHTGECFAEVCFATPAGRFRCHWSQHRARKKAGAELQLPKHEIANLDTGEIFESKLRGVAEHIETVTGMDFERFTRSMLLAQGGFAAFLQATADERAPILEQITGTEIYSEISIRVHEIRAAKRKQLDMLSAELGGMQLLTDEEMVQLNDRLAEQQASEITLNQQAAQFNHAMAWLVGIAQLEQALVQVETKRSQLEQRQQGFQSERVRLLRATQALELAGEYAALQTQRRELTAEQQQVQVSNASMLDLDLNLSAATNTLHMAEAVLVEKKQVQKDAALVIRQVRELDFKLSEKESPIKELNQTLKERQGLLHNLSEKHDADRTQLALKGGALAELERQLHLHVNDQGLVEHLTGLRGRLDACQQLHHQCNLKNEALKQIQQQLLRADEVLSDNNTDFLEQQTRLEQVQIEHQHKKQALDSLLEGRALSAWRKDVAIQQQRHALFEQGSETSKLLRGEKRVIAELSVNANALSVDEERYNQQQQAQQEALVVAEREVSLLTTQLTLLKKIQGFEDARHQLVDGQACPLCGATGHPFAEGNIPQAEAAAVELNKASENLKAINDQLTDTKVSLAEVFKDRQQLAMRLSESAEKAMHLSLRLKQICVDLAIEAINEEDESRWCELQQQQENALRTLEELFALAENLDGELIRLRELLDASKEAFAQLTHKRQESNQHKLLAQQECQRQQHEFETANSQRQIAMDAMVAELSVYGVAEFSLTNLSQVQQDLTMRRDRWLAWQSEYTSLESLINTISLQLQHQDETIQSVTTEVAKLKEQLLALSGERDQLWQVRYDLLADKKVDDEEARYTTEVFAAEESFERARTLCNEVSQQRAQVLYRLESLKESLGLRVAQLQLAEGAFVPRLTSLNFINEADYQQANLPEEQRKALQLQAQRLSDEQTELNASFQEKTAQLQAECDRQLSDLSAQALEQLLGEVIDNQKRVLKELGGIQQKLSENEQLKASQQLRLKAMAVQQGECSRWDTLHELIGSADGKKYRNFAQGLTFEMMVSHANRQLQKMSDRYLLVRDGSQPLELNVIDNYQAGEIRSTKNLSGGESFIISLALALGLSQMASKNVRVDSLFLDEGFGTLDDEALETALATLAGLQQEGKLIGVISHVGALKERISTQIQVQPLTGGRSVLRGPGCVSVD